MNVNVFVTRFQIQPADAVVLNKKFFGMVDHFVIYLGIIELEHQFVANFVDGVKVIPATDINKWLVAYVPSKIERFPGPASKRSEALKRAFSMIGQRAYNYIANNCEHFKNFVHYGIASSSQVTKAGIALSMGGLGLALIGSDRKNSSMAWWGIIILVIGIIVTVLGSDQSKKTPTK